MDYVRKGSCVKYARAFLFNSCYTSVLLLDFGGSMNVRRLFLTCFLCVISINVFAQQIGIDEYAQSLLLLDQNMKLINIGTTYLVFDETMFDVMSYKSEEVQYNESETLILKSKKTKLAVYYQANQGTFFEYLEVRNIDERKGTSGVDGKVIGILANNIYVRKQSYETRISINHKYTYDGKKFINIKQPFYYIGEKSKTNTLVKIYNDIDESILVATLAPNTEVEVIGLFENPFSQEDEGFSLLLKGKTGIIGWHKGSFLPQKEGDPYNKLTGTIDILSGNFMP